MIFLGVALVLLGVFAMAWSRRLAGVDADGGPVSSASSLSVFLLGCVGVAIGAVIVTEWWVS